MILIKPDHQRRIEIAGVPVPRPVDIDQSTTGFTSLRTLRIYQFAQGSLIEGHSEEDEVFIVVLSGSIELTIIPQDAPEFGPDTLLAPPGSTSVTCAAYLPPHATYKLATQNGADVAYARATPTHARAHKVFSSLAEANSSATRVLFEETSHAERLRIRLVSFQTSSNSLAFAPIHPAEQLCESLIHVRAALPSTTVASINPTPAQPISQNAFSPYPMSLDSWDTVAVMAGEGLLLHLAPQSSGSALIVMAR